MGKQPNTENMPVGPAGDCDRCRDEESGESTGVYNSGDDAAEDWRVCPCGTEPEVPEE
jgi:hypothetical protein